MHNTKKFGDIATSSKGKKPDLIKKNPVDGLIPYVDIKGFEEREFRKYTDGKGCRLCEDGDLLMVWDGSRSGLVGKAPAGAIGSTLAKIEMDGVDNDYGYYFLKSHYQYLNTNPKGSGTPHVDPDLLWNLDIRVPSIDEQHCIVEKIEELFSELDNGVENLKKAQKQLDTYRQAVLKDAFEGKLTNKIFTDGKLPEDWKWVNIEYFLSESRKGMRTGPFGTMLKKSEHKSTGIPVLGIENIGEGVFKMPNKIFISEKKAVELENFKVKENDALISRSGTVGEICLVPKRMEGAIISTNLMKISLNQNIMLPKFFVYLFQGGKVRQQVFKLCKGSSRAFLNQRILKSIEFPYCPLDEQEEIVNEIESRLSVVDQLELTITENLQKAEALRQSILKKAFGGELVEE